jgi:hypothetical protein
MRMSSSRPACARQSLAGSILQRKPRMSSTSSGLSPARIVPAPGVTDVYDRVVVVY